MSTLAHHLEGWLKIRPEERSAVAAFALLFALSEAGRGIGRNTADALFFLRFGVEHLPSMYLLLGLLTFLAMAAYAAGLSRFRWRVPLFVYLFFSALLLVERAAVPFDLRLVYPSLWLTVNVIAWVLVTSGWMMAGEAFDARQARRLFSLFASASILGGVVGNALTGPLANLLGTENLVSVYAGILILGFFAARRIAHELSHPSQPPGPSQGPLRDILTGITYLRRSRLLRLIAISSVLFSVLFFSISFPFSQAVSASFPDEASVAGFLGNFTSLVTLATFLVSLVLATRLYRWLGLVNVILMVPLMYLAGFALWAVAFSLTTAMILRFAQLVLINGAGWTAWNALFNVFHVRKRGQLRAFESGLPAQAGIALSGILLFLGNRNLTNFQLFIMGAVTAVVCACVCWRMRSAYGEALLDAIRAGIVDVFGETGGGVSRVRADAQARRTVISGLNDPRPTVRRISAEIAGKVQAGEASPTLSSLLEDSYPEVRAAAAASLGELNGSQAAQDLRRLLSDPDSAVRMAALESLRALDALDEPSLELASRDPNPRLRARAALTRIGMEDNDTARQILTQQALDKSPEARTAALEAIAAGGVRIDVDDLLPNMEHPVAQVRRAAIQAIAVHPMDAVYRHLHSAIVDPDPSVREEVARALATDARGREFLLKSLNHGSLPVKHAALEALNGSAEGVKGELVSWMVAQLPRASMLQETAMVLSVHASASASVAFLADLLRHRLHQLQALILKALSLVESPEAMAVVQRGLRSDNKDTRSQAIEALDTLGDRRIVNEFLPLLEAPPPGASQRGLDEVLQALSDDEDAWVRALAIEAQSARLARRAKHLRRKAEADPSPIVRQVAARIDEWSGGEMSEMVRTLSTMDRILCLRQVPIFAELGPEDLQQIAEVADERWIHEGEHLCREGEVGDELFILVEGKLLITKQVNGEQKYLRTFGPGEHVGELAILREQPRSASVLAVEGDVLVLVIAGEAMQAILRDRPQVSLAMLASLAERLGTMP